VLVDSFIKLRASGWNLELIGFLGKTSSRTRITRRVLSGNKDAFLFLCVLLENLFRTESFAELLKLSTRDPNMFPAIAALISAGSDFLTMTEQLFRNIFLASEFIFSASNLNF